MKMKTNDDVVLVERHFMQGAYEIQEASNEGRLYHHWNGKAIMRGQNDEYIIVDFNDCSHHSLCRFVVAQPDDSTRDYFKRQWARPSFYTELHSEQDVIAFYRKQYMQAILASEPPKTKEIA